MVWWTWIVLSKTQWPWGHLFVALLIALVPYEHFVVKAHLQTLQRRGAQFLSLSVLEGLRKYKLLLFHLQGSLCLPAIEVIDIAIDEHQGYEKNEIEEALGLMVNDRHPVGQILKRFPPIEKLLKLKTLHTLPHLGLSAEFSDASHQNLHATLGGMPWHKILQHEISEELLTKLREWRKTNSEIILLSFNKKIVAALALRKTLRPHLRETLKALKSSGHHLALLSSSSQAPKEVSDFEFAAIELATTPLEQQVHRKRWQERATPILEITNAWDLSPEARLVFNDFAGDHLTPRPDLSLISEDPRHIPLILRQSQLLFWNRITLPLITPLMVATLALSSSDSRISGPSQLLIISVTSLLILGLDFWNLKRHLNDIL